MENFAPKTERLHTERYTVRFLPQLLISLSTSSLLLSLSRSLSRSLSCSFVLRPNAFISIRYIFCFSFVRCSTEFSLRIILSERIRSQKRSTAQQQRKMKTFLVARERVEPMSRWAWEREHLLFYREWISDLWRVANAHTHNDTHRTASRSLFIRTHTPTHLNEWIGWIHSFTDGWDRVPNTTFVKMSNPFRKSAPKTEFKL